MKNKNTYPKELPVFEIINGCKDCKGLHSEGAPSYWGGHRIDLWSCVCTFEPFEIEDIKPLNKAAKDMIVVVKNNKISYTDEIDYNP